MKAKRIRHDKNYIKRKSKQTNEGWTQEMDWIGCSGGKDRWDKMAEKSENTRLVPSRYALTNKNQRSDRGEREKERERERQKNLFFNICGFSS